MTKARTQAATARLRGLVIWIVTGILLVVGIGLLALGPTITDEENLQQISRALGSFITVTIVLGFLYRVTVGPYDLAVFGERISEMMRDEIDRTYSATAGYGFGGINESIDFSVLFENLQKSETLWWLDTYDPLHEKWLPAIRQALGSGAHVNMLILNPESPMVEHRSKELHRITEAFKEPLTSFLNRMREIAKQHPSKLTIKLYDDLPCAPIYVVTAGQNFEPQQGYSSYFLAEATGIKFPHFVWRQGSQPFLDELFRYVSEKWDRAAQQTVGDGR